jgi:hypothetical protein
MALKKNIPTIYGVDAVYWKIISMDTKFKGNTIVSISGYISKEARFDDVEPLFTITKSFNLEDITRADAYAEFKKSEIVDGVEQNIFAGALDD